MKNRPIINWKDWIAEEATKPYLKRILLTIQARSKKHKVYPEYNKIFRAFSLCPTDRVKVVILGQDPYPQPGVADGLAFSTQKPNYIPKTLEIVFKEIGRGIEEPEFETCDLSGWAKQGVLLLNTSFTVVENRSGSDSELWKPFTIRVLQMVSQLNRPTVFMLWGSHSKQYRPIIDNSLFNYHNLILESVHPIAESRGSGQFVGCDHFVKCNSFLEKKYGEGQGIDWRTYKEEPYPTEWKNFKPKRY